MSVTRVAWLVLVAGLALQEPWRVGIIGSAPGSPDSDAFAFVRGAELAVAEATARGRKVELVIADDGGQVDGAKAAVAELKSRNVLGLIGPLDASLVAPCREAASAAHLPLVASFPPQGDAICGKACCALVANPASDAAAIVAFATVALRTGRVGLITDKTPAGVALQKELQARLSDGLVLNESVPLNAKNFPKQLTAASPIVLILDVAPAEAMKLIGGPLAACPARLLLTPRAFGSAVRKSNLDVFVMLGRSCATYAEPSRFLGEHRKRFDAEPGFGAAEGYEAAVVLLSAIEAAEKAGTLPEIALQQAHAQGARGPLAIGADGFAVDFPLQVWRLKSGALTPYAPSVIPRDLVIQGTPDPGLGVPFGQYRSEQFSCEDGTQIVVFAYDDGKDTDGKNATIDEDLQILGLSTGGAHPAIDHLIKEEILARMIAITSAKFLRNEDGSAIPGQSLKISLSAVPPKKKVKHLWTAMIGGDHPDAGGEAFPGQGRANIYSRFIRRTIFESHAIKPPVGQDDLPYFDGSYLFGIDPYRDQRSNLVRALINGYAGSMALTAAHELGHVAGLGHDTDDPHGIMNVAEGGGIDYRDGHFTETNLKVLEKRLGRVKATTK